MFPGLWVILLPEAMAIQVTGVFHTWGVCDAKSDGVGCYEAGTKR